jgi:hypothetical protein
MWQERINIVWINLKEWGTCFHLGAKTIEGLCQFVNIFHIHLRIFIKFSSRFLLLAFANDFFRATALWVADFWEKTRSMSFDAFPEENQEVVYSHFRGYQGRNFQLLVSGRPLHIQRHASSRLFFIIFVKLKFYNRFSRFSARCFLNLINIMNETSKHVSATFFGIKKENAAVFKP